MKLADLKSEYARITLKKAGFSLNQNIDNLQQLFRGKYDFKGPTRFDNPPEIMHTTPLCWATEYDDVELCRILLTNGANPNLTDYHGQSPYLLAIYFGRATIVNLLLNDFKVSPLQRDKNNHGFHYYYRAATNSSCLFLWSKQEQYLTKREVDYDKITKIISWYFHP